MPLIDRRSVQNFDWVLLGLIAVLVLAGVVNLVSATGGGIGDDSSRIVDRQLMALSFAGVVAARVMASSSCPRHTHCKITIAFSIGSPVPECVTTPAIWPEWALVCEVVGARGSVRSSRSKRSRMSVSRCWRSKISSRRPSSTSCRPSRCSSSFRRVSRIASSS